MRSWRTGVVLCVGLLSAPLFAQKNMWRMEQSLISFISEAPMEKIKATTTKASGVLDTEARTFAIQIPVATFEGFNNPLQREHFFENYLVSDTWPKATFQGRIIENVDLSKPGTYNVRAKGLLTIKGEARERIIMCRLVVHSKGVHVSSVFDVVVGDHGIRIPRVVQQKVAATVRVVVEAQFTAGGKN